MTVDEIVTLLTTRAEKTAGKRRRALSKRARHGPR
jgi:hypothetical protein